MSVTSPSHPNLTRFAWISIAAAVLTISLKLGAYWLTNSVGLLSDALESLVNLVSAIIALIALRIATRPADEEFTYGYSKIEFFSSGFEGGMILIAAGSIAFTAIQRLAHPQPVEQIGLGLLISVIASLINLGASRVLAQAGKRYNSLTLEADARHLMTDVVTTGGVIIGVGLVSVTGLGIIDPLIALLVAANILWTGFHLLRHAYLGLMDVSLPNERLAEIDGVLKEYQSQGIQFHALRTRSAAARSFVSMHILVPSAWSVKRAHKVAEQVETRVRALLPQASVFTHIEPVEDPASWQDNELEKD
jgi:cation diffusion facilitator family transporter